MNKTNLPEINEVFKIWNKCSKCADIKRCDNHQDSLDECLNNNENIFIYDDIKYLFDTDEITDDTIGVDLGKYKKCIFIYNKLNDCDNFICKNCSPVESVNIDESL